MASQARRMSSLELRGEMHETGSISTNNAATKYFNIFEDSIEEDYFDNVQSIQLKFFDWAQCMMQTSPLHQGRPVDPKTTIYNYYDLIKTRLKEIPASS